MKSIAFPIIFFAFLAVCVICQDSNSNSTTSVNSTDNSTTTTTSTISYIGKAAYSPDMNSTAAWSLFKMIIGRQNETKDDTNSPSQIVVDSELNCLHVKPWCMMASFTQVPKDKSSSLHTIDIGSSPYTCTNELQARINETIEYMPLQTHAIEMTLIHSCSQIGKILKFGTRLPTDESPIAFFNGMDLTNMGRGLLTHKLHDAK